MDLECEQSISSTDVTAADIQNAFADDAGRGGYIILSQSEQVYIQAIGEGDGPYTLEYRQGSGERHYQCPQDLTKEQVETAFLKYLTGDIAWQNDHEWQRLEIKPWWKFW